MQYNEGRGPSKALIIIGVVLLIALVVGGVLVGRSLRRVDPGKVGVLVHYRSQTVAGQPDSEVVGSGQFKWINPVFDGWWEYDVSQQTLRLDGEDAVTCRDTDSIELVVDSSTLWRVDAIHADLLYINRPEVPLRAKGEGRIDIEDLIVRREVRNAITDACSQMRYDEIYGVKRGDFIDAVEDQLAVALPDNYILFEKFLLGEITPPEAQRQAIEQKALAQQQALEAELRVAETQAQAQQAIARAEGEKQSAILSAEGEAQAILIAAEAQAEAINQIEEALRGTDFYIEYQTVQNWDGVMPRTLVLSDGSEVPIISTFDLEPETTE